MNNHFMKIPQSQETFAEHAGTIEDFAELGDFAWETDNSLILKVILVEKFMNESGSPKPEDFFYLRLKFK
ncbi:MAG: hypothetical protein V4548_09290 [Bacteroidota bacterium]